MSSSTSPADDGNSLTEDEKAAFERLAEHYDDDDPVARISELMVQSSEGSNS